MLKKAITYEDFNGQERIETFCFHLSKAELVELEMSHEDGLSKALKRIIAAENNKELIAEFKNIILTAYGVQSEDGRRFIKSQELRDEFVSTEAYSVLFMELVTDTGAAIEFINGIIPAGLAVLEAAKVVNPEEEKPTTITRAEFQQLPAEELKELGPRLTSGEVKLVE